MSRSNDAGHFFQTTDALATGQRRAAKAKNKHGNPIKLPSKILAAHIDPYSIDTPAIYVAEAAGEVKRVELESGKIERIFTQGNAPLTCLALCPKPRTLFTGSWDKTIYAIPLDDGPGEVRRFRGHSDFVKCLHVTTLSAAPVLLSGGADATVIVWDIATGAILQKIQAHSQALQALTIDPETRHPDGAGDGLARPPSQTLFTSTSSPHIRRFDLSRITTAAAAVELSPDAPIHAHETSIYALEWDSSADLWTASADKTARRLVRERGWAADTELVHPDFVRGVAVFDALGLVVTACRDEEVRVWEVGSGELVCTYAGHFDEVTAVVGLLDGRTVASVGIDGTVRKWSLDRAEMGRYKEMVERAQGEEGAQGEGQGQAGGSALTAEEEAELAELMDDDDDD